MESQDADILNLESQLGLAKADCRDLKNQMSLINGLFTQMLLSASSAEMDLDRLTQLLQVLISLNAYIYIYIYSTLSYIALMVLVL